MQQHWLLVLIFVASTWKRTIEMARLFANNTTATPRIRDYVLRHDYFTFER